MDRPQHHSTGHQKERDERGNTGTSKTGTDHSIRDRPQHQGQTTALITHGKEEMREEAEELLKYGQPTALIAQRKEETGEKVEGLLKHGQTTASGTDHSITALITQKERGKERGSGMTLKTFSSILSVTTIIIIVINETPPIQS